MPPLEAFDQTFLIECLSTERWICESEALFSSEFLRFYTDGSLFEDSGVFVSEELDFRNFFTLVAFATVFQTEFHVILACSDHCLKECMSGKRIWICSDSQAAFLALS
jgi:hypothetical protein